MSFTIKDVLRMEVAPALGCTEPAAVALGAAAAASLLDTQTISHIELWVDAHVYKNGMAVSLPGAPDLVGLDTASALGAICGDPHLRLEVLEPVGAPAIAAARQLLKTGAVRVNLLAQQDGPFVRTVITSGNDNAEAIVSGSHDNIVYLAKNGQPVTDSPLLSAQDQNAGVSRLTELEGWLKELSLPELVGLVDRIDAADIAFLREGVRLNTELAEYGLKHNCGMGVGKAMERLVRQRLIKKDMILAAKMLTSAASDARMAGIKLPAMSSAGSGNHGLTAILPIWAVKDYIECEERTVYEAIALSHVITGFVKAYTGRLSALCGCSIAAGAGATAGITYLLGGGLQHIAGAIKNLSEDLAGVICDGAKAGCSLKLATAAGSAVQASLFALQGVQVQFTDGIIERSPEKTMQNIGTLSTEGSLDMDRAILRIMMEKEFSG